jgi:hypothetical protein
MSIYGIFKDDFGFYCFQKKETTKSKENTSNNKHATTEKSIADSNIQWDGTTLQMFYQKNWYYYGTYHKINQKDKNFSLDKRMLKGLGIDQT